MKPTSKRALFFFILPFTILAAVLGIYLNRESVFWTMFPEDVVGIFFGMLELLGLALSVFALMVCIPYSIYLFFKPDELNDVALQKSYRRKFFIGTLIFYILLLIATSIF